MTDLGMDILYEGLNYVVVNKPAGIAVEKNFNNDTVEKRAMHAWQRARSIKKPFVGIVHRLDRPVSGALILARNISTLRLLNAAFAEQKVHKRYIAITDRPLPKERGELKHFIMRGRYGKKAIAASRPLPGAKEALLKYELIRATADRYHWLIIPVTGRFHQIRVQLATVGCPIVGDMMYGSSNMLAPFKIALHARQLEFPDPLTGKSIVVEAPFPSYWPDAMNV